MASINDIIARTRYLLQDENSYTWDDEKLAEWINEGQRVYCEKTGCLRGSFDIMANSSGIGSYPEDYIGYVFGINENLDSITTVSSASLFEEFGNDYDLLTGSVAAIYDDLENPPSYHIFPLFAQSLTVMAQDQHEGEVLEIVGSSLTYDTWGVIDGVENYNIYGIWGVTALVYDYVYAGKIQYSKLPVDGSIQIMDADALVYYCAGMAFRQETDRNNINLADSMFSLFNSRIGITVRTINCNHGESITQGEYF